MENSLGTCHSIKSNSANLKKGFVVDYGMSFLSRKLAVISGPSNSIYSNLIKVLYTFGLE